MSGHEVKLTILLLPCRLILMASSNRLDQRGSTKLARHQQSLLLRARLVGEQIPVAVRPHWWTEPNQDFKKWWEATSKAPCCDQAVDIDVPRLISASASSFSHLPSCRTKLTHSPLGNRQSATGSKSESDKGSLKLWIEIWNASPDTVLGLFLLIAWVMQCQTISKPRKHLASVPNKNKQKQAQQLDALLLSSGLLWDHRPRLNTKVFSQKANWKEKAENFFNNLQCSKAGVADIRQVRLDLKWIGVGFLDLAIFLRVVWECRCNIKHQLMLETSYLGMETHANSTPVQVYATCTCLPKSKAKENGHCQKKILPRLWTTIWQRRAVWKTLFQNKSSGTINPAYLPLELLNNTKAVSMKTRCLSQILPNTLSYNLWGTSHEQQWHPSSYACSTLAVSLKRWDVEAGTIKRTQQRNKGMAEKHTKSLV